MPAADPLSSLREPARPYPPAAGSEQAESAARFVGVLSQALEGGAFGPVPPRDDPSAKDPGRSDRSPVAAKTAEGVQPAATVPVLASLVAPAPALTAAGPVGTGFLPAAPVAAAEVAETGANGTATPEREEGVTAPLPAALPAPSPTLTALSGTATASVSSGVEADGAPPSGAPPSGVTPGGVIPGTAGVVPSREAPGKEAAPMGGRSPAAGSAAHAATAPRASVPNARAPGTGALEPQPLDPSHARDVPADAAGETARINRAAPASRYAAAREDAASWPEEESVQDTPPAPDPIPMVPAVALVVPAATPAFGGAARDAGPDGSASATTAAPAENGPAAPPASVRVARATPAPEATPESDSASPEGVPPPGGEAPEVAGVSGAPGTADVQPSNAPAADSAPPQPAAQPAHAAPSRPAAESHPPAGHTAPRAAVEQLAPTLVQVAAGPTAAGGHRMVVRLDPAELGKVEVRVERAEAGPAQVSLTVDRPETLLLLLRDQPALHRALDQAGVPAEGRALHFQLAPAAPEGAPADRGGGAGWGATADGGKGDGTWNGPGHGQGQGGQPGGRHRGHAPADAAAYGIHRAWRDAGLDITA